ncbi:guanylate kinase [Euzebya pacifica]|uniref:guanylate kinase n=1 Tax=Euzebya pacifica TaxID=1608957 RepID=UPI0030F6A542
MSEQDHTPGTLLVVSGPGGVGKGTVVAALRERHDEIEVSLSATTRRMRPGEEDGVHYRFVSPTEFRRMADDGEFLEWAEFNGHFYGTPWSSVTDRLAAGATLVLEIDVQGAKQVRQRQRDVGDIAATLVFLEPPSWDDLERRLRHRGSENEETIEQRLTIGREEMAQAEDFDHRVVNDRVDAAVKALERILALQR